MKLRKVMALAMGAVILMGTFLGCSTKEEEGRTDNKEKSSWNFLRRKEKLLIPLIRLLRNSITARMKSR